MLRFFLCVLVFLVLLLVGCQPGEPPFKCTDAIGCVDVAPGDPVKIGVLQDLSGGAAPIGEGIVKSIELAIDSWEGELLGHSIVLHQEDEQCTPQGGANAALRIIADIQIVAIIGTTCSNAAVTASAIMSEAGLVMISGANATPSLTGIGDQKGEDWQAGYFRTVQNGMYWGPAVATFAVKELGITKAATIDDGDTYSTGLTSVFVQEFERLGGELVEKATISNGDPDMMPVLTTIFDAGAQFIFAPVFPPEADQIVIQLDDMKGADEIRLMLSSTLMLESFLESVGDAGQGAYFIASTMPEGPDVEQFNADFKAKYGSSPPHPVIPFNYDATRMLLTALETVAVQDSDGTLHIGRQALRDALYATEDFGGITSTLTCNTFGDCGPQLFHVMRLDDPDAGLDALSGNVIYTYIPER